jgi:hypothetical protein
VVAIALKHQIHHQSDYPSGRLGDRTTNLINSVR